MPTNYYDRQGILEKVIRFLFSSHKDMTSIPSTDIDKDKSLFDKMIKRRGLSDTISTHKNGDEIIFKIK